MEELRIAVIIASTRRGRFGPTVAGWFAAKARRRVTVDLIDLAETRLPERLEDTAPPAVAELGLRLGEAEGFVIVTPEYNHSFPAPLKTALDWYFDEWHAKPVTFVSYGRETGGHLAVAQLRQIFIELRAVPIRETVSLPNYWDLFAPDGGWPRAGADCELAAKTTLDQLIWWAKALRTGRTTS